MELQPGMVFVNDDNLYPIIIISSQDYIGHGDQRPIHHRPGLEDDLKKYGWLLDESSVVDLILKKYET